jgi:hypothetical protein
MNRTERRAAAHAAKGHSKPPKSFRWARSSGIQAANFTNTPLTPAERAKVLNLIKQSRHRLATANATYIDYVTLCTARHRCQAANDMGLVRPAGDLLQAAHDVLDALGRDCHRPQIEPHHWTPRAVRFSELAAIDDLLAVYRTVVQVCTYGEWCRIEEKSLARVRSEGGELVQAVGAENIGDQKTAKGKP